IVNGDALAIALVSAGTKGLIPPKTDEQKLARKNELKAKRTLLLAILNEHLLKFYGIKDEKTLWEAIKAMFGGHKEFKKMQKTILKQQYENFVASRSEALDKTYDRFQKLISQLEIHGEVISHEDANLKLLRSLPLAWNNIALIIRNKSDLDTLSMYDLYNIMKVYEFEIIGQSSSSSNSQNVAFVSSENTSSTNEAVNTAHDVSTASSQGQASSSTYADDVMFSFFANQYNSPQLDNEDLEQINTDDLEEMDLKWQVAMLTMRVKCYNCHRRGHFARECRASKNQRNRNGDAPERLYRWRLLQIALLCQDEIVHQVQSSSDSEVIKWDLESLEAINVAKQNSQRAAASVSTAMPVNTAAPKSKEALTPEHCTTFPSISERPSLDLHPIHNPYSSESTRLTLLATWEKLITIESAVIPPLTPRERTIQSATSGAFPFLTASILLGSIRGYLPD
ncbi:putative ribonuclease H-like domain-containing protein, partial [Tanacetum coccineum]